MHPWKYKAALGLGKQRAIAFLIKHHSVQKHMILCQIHKITNQQKTVCQGTTP